MWTFGPGDTTRSVSIDNFTTLEAGGLLSSRCSPMGNSNPAAGPEGNRSLHPRRGRHPRHASKPEGHRGRRVRDAVVDRFFHSNRHGGR